MSSRFGHFTFLCDLSLTKERLLLTEVNKRRYKIKIRLVIGEQEGAAVI
jgi:hypothetical protein